MKKADLIYWKKGRFPMSSGKTIIIEMDVWLSPRAEKTLLSRRVEIWLNCP